MQDVIPALIHCFTPLVILCCSPLLDVAALPLEDVLEKPEDKKRTLASYTSIQSDYIADFSQCSSIVQTGLPEIIVNGTSSVEEVP